MFAPLAYTKTFAMAASALLSVTLVPVLMLLFIRGKVMPEKKNPLNRFLIWIYRPIIDLVLHHRAVTILVALAALVATWVPASRLGSEFMSLRSKLSSSALPAAFLLPTTRSPTAARSALSWRNCSHTAASSSRSGG